MAAHYRQPGVFTRDTTRTDVPQLPDATKYGEGPAWVDGVLEYSDSVQWTKRNGHTARSGYRTLLLGDSITQRAGEGNGRTWTLNAATENSTNTYSGPFTPLNAISGHPFNVVRNGGVAGQKSGEIAARFDSEWDAAVANAGGVDVVSIMAGTNDLAFAGYSADVTYTNVVGMADKALSRGAFVLIWAIPPKNSLTTSSVQHKQRANQMLRDFCNKTPNTLFVDSEQETTDNSVVTAAWKTNYATDGVHPNSFTSNYLIGRNAATRIQQLFRPWPLIACAADSFDGIGSPGTGPFGDGTNILTAAQSLGTGSGTATPGTAAIVGTPANGWTLQTGGAGLTVTCSQQARADGVGNDQQFSCVIASGTGHTSELFYQSAARFTVGKWYELSAEIQIVSGEAFIEKMWCSIRAAAGSLTYARDLDYANMSANAAQPTSPLTYRVVTPRWPMQSGDTPRVLFSWDYTDVAGTVVIKIGRVSVREYSSQV